MKEYYTIGNRQFYTYESTDWRDGENRWFVCEVTTPKLPYNTNHGLMYGKAAALTRICKLAHVDKLPPPEFRE